MGIPGERLYGDDATIWTYVISLFSKQFPYPQWDQCCFAGYQPAGLGLTILLPQALFVKIGFPVALVLNYSFLASFLLLGFSVYYFVMKINGSTVIGVTLAMLLWITNTQWNATIWGASYDRFFAIPLLFFCLGCGYDYVSHLPANGFTLEFSASVVRSKRFLLFLLLSILLFMGNVVIAIITVQIVFVFIVLSQRQLRKGLIALTLVWLPALAFTEWYWTRILFAFLNYSTQTAVINDLTPNSLLQLYFPGGTWSQTLTYSYLPLLALTGVLAITQSRRKRFAFDRPALALLTSTSVWSLYWFVEGWVPQLWSIIPRIGATYDSTFYLGLTLVIIIGIFSKALTGPGVRFEAAKVMPRTEPLRSSRIGFRPSRQGQIGLLLFLLVLTNAYIVVPAVKPVDWGPLTQSLNATIDPSLNFGSQASQYRLAMTGRVLTRWFSYLHPTLPITSGRFFPLNPNPSFGSWFDYSVFYRGDLDSINTLYIEDRPGPFQSYYLDASTNIASTLFWMDWFASKTALFLPTFQPSDGTVAIYRASPLLNVTESALSQYPAYFVTNPRTSPVAIETNTMVLGFYETGPTASGDYNLLLALLSYLGLGPEYVAPVRLDKGSVAEASIDGLMTDYSTYSGSPSLIQTVANRGAKILVLGEGNQSSKPFMATPSVSFSPLSLEALAQEGPTGSYELIQTLFASLYDSPISLTNRRAQPAGALMVPPQNWTISYALNVESTLQVKDNATSILTNATDSSQRGQVDISYPLIGSPITSAMSVSLQVMTDVQSIVALVFCPDESCQNYLRYDTVVPDTHGNWSTLSANVSQFAWKFFDEGIVNAKSFTVVFNIPNGTSSASFQVRNAVIRTPSTFSYSLPSPLSSNLLGFLKLAEGQHAGESIYVGSQDSGYMRANLSGSNGATVIPLSEFSGRIRVFDEIVSNNDLGQNPQMILLSEPTWKPLVLSSDGGANASFDDIEEGYKGIIWKENDSPDWLFTGRNGTLIPHYSAGPGMTFIPISGSVATLTVRMNTLDSMVEIWMITSVAAATVLVAIGLYPRSRPSRKICV